VEPITHALTSLVLGRAGQKRLPRYGLAMLVVSGVAADLDSLSYFGGAEAYLRFHRTGLHSLAGSAVLVFVVAGAFYIFARTRHKNVMQANPTVNAVPLRFAAALAVCASGVLAHMLLDLASGIGVQLLWPFRDRWSAWDLLTNLDPWILILLLLGISLPEVLRLVSEEMGERKKTPRGERAAVITLLLLVVYICARGGLHSRAIDLISSREYHGQPPLASGAFPSSFAPFTWRGVISTESTVEEAEISLAPGAEFDPDRTHAHFKPDNSAALDAAQSTNSAKRFLRYARFPLATMQRNDDGFVFVLRDMRFAANDMSLDNIVVRVELDSGLHVIHEDFRFSHSSNR
jgi:membrane-bound metal-dependent hydrolase YbcI (DUF457 family)